MRVSDLNLGSVAATGDAPLLSGDRCGWLCLPSILCFCTNSYSSGAPAARRHVEAGHLVPTLDSLLYQTGSSLVGLRTYCWGMDGGASLDRVLHGVTDVVILAGPIDDPIVSLQRGGAEAVHRPIGRVRPTNVGFILSYSDSGTITDNAGCTNSFAPIRVGFTRKQSADPIAIATRSFRLSRRSAVLCDRAQLPPRMRFDLTANEFARELFQDGKIIRGREHFMLRCEM